MGLTGGIGSGKSTVSQMLQTLGASVIDADLLVHRMQMRGQSLWMKYFQELGLAMVDAHGQLLRRKIARRMFLDDTFRVYVSGLVHPLVQGEIARIQADLEQQGKGLIVLDIPLLIESQWDSRVDQVWVVYATLDQQCRRVQERDGLSREDAELRINSQMGLSQKMARADVVINNTGSLDHLKREVMNLWEHVGAYAAIDD